MRTYRLPPSGFPAYRRTLIRTGLVVSGVVLALALSVSLSQTERDQWPVLLVGGPFVALLLGLGVRKAIRQQKEVWSSVEIRMDDGAIGRAQLRIPEILLRREDVTAVVESPRGLVVKTTDRFRSLFIPRLLDPRDYAEIREDLATWVPIKTAGSGAIWMNRISLVLLIGGFAVMLFSHDRLLVAVMALGLFLFYAWASWRAYRQEGYDPKTRKMTIVGLLFIVLIAALRLAALSGVL